MSTTTSIEWTDATWNPVTGCTEVSPGCDHCYARTFAERWRGVPGHYFERGFDLTLRPERLDQPLSWRRARRVFVNSMSDLFHPGVPDEFIARVFAVMAAAPRHTFQVLTKRPGRMRSLLNSHPFVLAVTAAWDALSDEHGLPGVTPPTVGGWPLPNVWLGVSVEDQRWADIRIPVLVDTPAAIRFLSCEPLLGPVDLSFWLTPPVGNALDASDALDPPASLVDWVIVGGESGPGARPMHPDWVRAVRDQCTAAGVALFFKQWGAYRPGGDAGRPAVWVDRHGRVEGFTSHGDQVPMVRVGKHAAGRMLDARTWNELPATAGSSGVGVG